jgi:chromosome segregation ATPase
VSRIEELEPRLLIPNDANETFYLHQNISDAKYFDNKIAQTFTPIPINIPSPVNCTIRKVDVLDANMKGVRYKQLSDTYEHEAMCKRMDGITTKIDHSNTSIQNVDQKLDRNCVSQEEAMERQKQHIAERAEFLDFKIQNCKEEVINKVEVYLETETNVRISNLEHQVSELKSYVQNIGFIHQDGIEKLNRKMQSNADVHKNDIEGLSRKVQSNADGIERLNRNVQSNADAHKNDIEGLSRKVQSNADAHKNDIEGLSRKVQSNADCIERLSRKVQSNADDIKRLKEKMDENFLSLNKKIDVLLCDRSHHGKVTTSTSSSLKRPSSA